MSLGKVVEIIKLKAVFHLREIRASSLPACNQIPLVMPNYERH